MVFIMKAKKSPTIIVKPSPPDPYSSTKREVLKHRGLEVNLKAFPKIKLKTSNCKEPGCAHPPGKVSLRKLIDKFLDDVPTVYPSGSYECKLLAINEVLAGQGLPWEEPTTLLIKAAGACSYALDRTVNLLKEHPGFQWQPEWASIFKHLPGEPSPQESYYASLRDMMKDNEEHLWHELKRTTHHMGSGSFGPLRDAGDVMVFVKPFPTAHAVLLNEDFMIAAYGPTGLSGVSKLPLRMMEKFRIDDVVEPLRARYAYLWAKSSHVWFFGFAPCEEPVRVLSTLTPEVIEVASVLLENMSIKDALTAAVEV